MQYEPTDPETAQTLADAASQCRRSMEAAGLKDSEDPTGQVVNLETLIRSYPEGHIPNDESVFQFVALLGEAVRAAYDGAWVKTDMGSGEELGIVTDGPHGEIFWNLTGKLRRRLHRIGGRRQEQDSLVFYWETIGEQLAR